MARSRPDQAGADERGCAGFRGLWTRRQAIQAGVFGALGLSLGDMLRLEARAGSPGTQAFSAAAGGQGRGPARALGVIQLHLGGGMPQQVDPAREPVSQRP